MLAALMKKKILIVEDEEPLRFLYEEKLNEEGYEVLTACNGKEVSSLAMMSVHRTS